ncbi:MAG: MFS transporter [Anaerolineae bacterium]|nr:MFS transporter [Anaerolineae bacterium]
MRRYQPPVGEAGRIARDEAHVETGQPQSAALARTIWLIRLLYLAVYGSYGTTSVYRPLYYRRVGLSEAQIGILIALSPLAMLLAGPIWSLIADRFRLHRRLLTIVTGLSIVPTLAMAAVHSFWGLLALDVLYSIFLGPIQPLMDSTALTVLGKERHRYANIRAYGSLGYAPIAWLMGLFIQGRDIRWIFVGYALLMGVGCLATLRVRVEQAALPRSIGEGLSTLLRNPAWLIFMAAVFVAMMGQTVSFGYISLYLDSLGAREGLIGFSGALGSLGQTLLMLGVLSWLLRGWGSQGLMVLALAIYGLRFAIWSLFPIPSVVTGSQVIMGLAFGSALVASVDFADRHAPAGMKATSQALVTSLISGLGRSAGGVLAGALYDTSGPRVTFAVFGALSAGAAVVFALIWRRRAGRRQTRGAAAPS